MKNNTKVVLVSSLWFVFLVGVVLVFSLYMGQFGFGPLLIITIIVNIIVTQMGGRLIGTYIARNWES